MRAKLYGCLTWKLLLRTFTILCALNAGKATSWSPPRLGFEVRDGLFWTVLSDTERTRTGKFQSDGIESGIRAIESLIQAGELAKHLKTWPGKNGQKAKKSKRS